MMLTQTAIRVVDPTEDPDWDANVIKYPECNLFHSAAWAAVLHESYRYKPLYYVQGQLEARGLLFPVMEVRSMLTGTRAVSLPFTDVCEPLGGPSGSSEKLLVGVMEDGAARRWRYWNVHGGSELFGRATASAEYFGHVLDLTAGVNDLLGNLAGSVRQCLRRAEREEVKVRHDASMEGLQKFYRLHCRTRRKHGAPPQPFRFFERIYQWVLRQGKGILLLAERGSTPLAAALFLHFGGSAIYKFGASDERHQQLRANNAVMWEAIRYYATNSYRTLHFGRTSTSNEGLRRFKLGWGSVESVIRYYSYDFGRRMFRVEGDPSDSAASRVFRSLPVFVNRWIGRLAYRHIA
jgi:hypothetical protein